jgi:hypothetical protein
MTHRLLPSLLLLVACAVAPPPPEPDTIAAPVVEESGRIAAVDPARAAFCASLDIPDSQVVMVRDGAALRPAAGQDYALTLVLAGEQSLAWRLRVAQGAEDPAGTAARLRAALTGCVEVLGRQA